MNLRLREEEQRRAFGQELRRIRLARGIKQQELAESLRVSPSFLSKIENGSVPPPRGFIDRLIEPLGLSIDEQIRLMNLLQGERETSLPPVLDPSRLFEAVQLFQGLFINAFGPRVQRQLSIDYREKLAIGHYLATALDEFVEEKKRVPIILDSGTTILFLAYSILTLGSTSSQWDIYTGNLLAALYLAQARNVYLIGGRLDREFGASLGSETIKQLRELVQELVTRGDTKKYLPPLGILSCVGFSPSEGPFVRAKDLTETGGPDSKEGPSKHYQWKQIILESIPFVILLVTSDKLLRPDSPMWRATITPIESWHKRCEETRYKTQVILALPEDNRDRQANVFMVWNALTAGKYQFQAVQTLFGKNEGFSGNNNFITIVDTRTFCSLSSDEIKSLQRDLERSGRLHSG
jgi:transcriptional regulator with XRE-family HTH domain